MPTRDRLTDSSDDWNSVIIEHIQGAEDTGVNDDRTRDAVDRNMNSPKNPRELKAFTCHSNVSRPHYR